MTDDLATDVDRVLSNAMATLESSRAAPDEPIQADDLTGSRREELRNLAGEAADLLESTDPETLLDALGMGSPDGPGSIPEAILTGEADAVSELRALLSLSRLAPEADGDANAAFDDTERQALTRLADLLGDRGAGDRTAEPAASTPADDSPDETELTTEDGPDDAGDAITSALQTALADVREGIGDGRGDDEGDGLLGGDEGEILGGEGALGDDEGLLDGVRGILGGDGDDDGSKSDGDDGGGLLVDDGVIGGGDEEEVDGDDDGLLGGGAEPTGTGGAAGDRKSVSGYGRSTYSTVPSQDRPDMKGVRRHSTMAGR